MYIRRTFIFICVLKIRSTQPFFFPWKTTREMLTYLRGERLLMAVFCYFQLGRLLTSFSEEAEGWQMTHEVIKKKLWKGGGNGVDISDHGNRYKQNWAVDRVEITIGGPRGGLGWTGSPMHWIWEEWGPGKSRGGCNGSHGAEHIFERFP